MPTARGTPCRRARPRTPDARDGRRRRAPTGRGRGRASAAQLPRLVVRDARPSSSGTASSAGRPIVTATRPPAPARPARRAAPPTRPGDWRRYPPAPRPCRRCTPRVTSQGPHANGVPSPAALPTPRADPLSRRGRGGQGARGTTEQALATAVHAGETDCLRGTSHRSRYRGASSAKVSRAARA